MQTFLSFYNMYKTYLPVFLLLSIVIFFSTYKLSESPTIWMDEGIITQVAQNIALHGVHGLQIAPNDFISAGFVTTSYTVTFPVSLSFMIFGVSLLSARAVMVLFIFALFFAAYFFTKSLQGNRLVIIITLLLIATFPPLYGDGKNVLGEIPGLFYLLTGLLFVNRIEKGTPKPAYFLLSGLFISLALVTKPIFIMFGPALLFIVIALKKYGDRKKWSFFFGALCVPALIWLWVQFHHDSLMNILSIYANPHSTNFLISIKENALRFVTESQPFYFALSFGIWLVSIIIRFKKKIRIATVEYAAALFSVFILLAYLRTTGYYRYFLEAQFFSLLFLTPSLLQITKHPLLKKIVIGTLFLLIAFQLNQLFFDSWVATYYKSQRTAVFSNAVKSLPDNAHIYVYQVPEAMIFLPNDNFSQYMEVTKTIIVGKETLEEINTGKADFVILPEQVWNEGSTTPFWSHYMLKEKADRYTILQRQSQ